MRGVDVAERAVTVSREDRDGRILIAVGVLAEQVVLERAGSTTEQPKVVPSPVAGVLAQRGRIGSGGDDEVDVLRQMMSDAVEAVDPHRAHGTWIRLLLAVHEVIDHHGAVWSTEQLAEADTSCRGITGIEVSRAFLEYVVLDGCARWKPAAQFGDAFAPLHE